MGSASQAVTAGEAIEAAKVIQDYCAANGCRKCVFGTNVSQNTWRCQLDPMPVLWYVSEIRREELPSNGNIHCQM